MATATLAGAFNVGDPATMLPGFGPFTKIEYSVSLTNPAKNYTVGSQRVTAWIDANPGGTVIGYSQGSSIAIGALYDHPNDPRFQATRFIFIASPDTPNNGVEWSGKDGRKGPPTPEEYPDQTNLEFVVRQYDPVSDTPESSGNTLAQRNLKISTHIHDYENIDLDDPRNVVTVDPVTGLKVTYLPNDVLPMLKGRDWYTNDAKMAELDAKYRPVIDVAYVGQRPAIPAGPSSM